MSSNLPTDIPTQPTQKSTNPVAEKLLNVLLIVAVVAFVLVLVIKGFFVSNVLVKQQSMSPTLDDGQTIWVSKMAKPQRGDIVVFFTEDVQGKFLAGFLGDHEKFVKRVVAVEGDSVWVEQQSDGTYVFVVRCGDTGQIVADIYGEDASFTPPATMQANLGTMTNHVGEANALVVEGNNLFVLGDNRNNSVDSRDVSIGLVPLSRLFGVMM